MIKIHVLHRLFKALFRQDSFDVLGQLRQGILLFCVQALQVGGRALEGLITNLINEEEKKKEEEKKD